MKELPCSAWLGFSSLAWHGDFAKEFYTDLNALAQLCHLCTLNAQGISHLPAPASKPGGQGREFIPSPSGAGPGLEQLCAHL